MTITLRLQFSLLFLTVHCLGWTSRPSERERGSVLLTVGCSLFNSSALMLARCSVTRRCVPVVVPAITRRATCTSMFCLLLLAGDVQANPGPMAHCNLQRASLRIATLNARSVHLKAALINDIVTTEKLDCLVVTETWFNESSVYADLLPDGYGIHVANRPTINNYVFHAIRAQSLHLSSIHL
jgi:hypothetical protein